MKCSSSRAGKPGFVSYVLVLSTGLVLTMLMLSTYRRSMAAQAVQSTVQLRTDYGEKEDAVLRSIVAITPNRAIRAMQHNSDLNSANRNPLRWQDIFKESLDLANARTSIPGNVMASLNITDLISANVGDAALGTHNRIFDQIGTADTNYNTSYASAGINRSLGAGFPVPLSSSNPTTTSRDPVYPIICADKVYTSIAQSGVALPVGKFHKEFNLLSYPQINFGYAKPGQPFVAKRNWWAFSMDVADHDDDKTLVARARREFVLSIYEIPSQLAISASSFMSLGEFVSGEEWGDQVNIAGGVFAGKATVEGDKISALASRRGMSISNGSTIGGESFSASPFAPGVREAYQLTEGAFFPVSQASESGRVAFVPINRGAEFFDRFAHSAETTTLSPTMWNNYSIGALQCAMRLDVVQAESASNPMPTVLRFSYLKNGSRQEFTLPLNYSNVTGLPPGYLFACNENHTYNFGSAVVDVAYGKNGTYAFQTGVTGSITYNNARFGDPLVGVYKAGYYKPSYPFEITALPSGKICVAVYPQRFAKFLASLNADGPDVNNSLAVNVDYTTTTGSVFLQKPMPNGYCLESDYGVVIQECADLTSFTKGFSLVTNLRTYIGDDFNVVPMAPPSGYSPAGDYYPPCSLFAPEKRYGVELDPFAVKVEGQFGSLASESAANPVRPLESRTVSGGSLAADRITVNLRPISHPADLPPISMMNWLVVLEERRKEFEGN